MNAILKDEVEITLLNKQIILTRFTANVSFPTFIIVSAAFILIKNYFFDVYFQTQDLSISV